MKIEKIVIEGVRGIRYPIIVEPRDARNRPTSAIIYGRNGTGKSSITDAWELFQTGNIKHLAREGAGKGAYKNRDSDAMEVRVYITSGNDRWDVSLSDTESLEAFRREVPRPCQIRYTDLKEFVLKSKSEMFSELSSVMGLGSQTDYLKSLKRVEASLKKTVKAAEKKLASAPQPNSFLEQLLQYCETLGVEIEDAYQSDIDVVIERLAAKLNSQDQIAESSRSLLESAVVDCEQVGRLKRSLKRLFEQEGVAAAHLRAVMFEAASELVSIEETPQETCPLCTQATPDLAAHIQEELELLRGLRQEIDVVDSELSSTRDWVVASKHTLKTLLKCNSFSEGFSLALQATFERVNELETLLKLKVEALGVDSLRVLEDCILHIQTFDEQRKRELDLFSESRGEAQTDASAIRYDVDDIRRKIELYRVDARRLETLNARLSAFSIVVEHYRRENFAFIDGEMRTISEYVTKYFDILECGEGAFEDARIELDENGESIKLAAKVHGRDEIPAYSVLSESQLNSFGLAVHLATLKVHNPKLKFLILDDVINSFDAYKRPRLIELLADEFDDFQIILLTHDNVWRDRLYRKFRNWKKLETRPYDARMGTQFNCDLKAYTRICSVKEKINLDRPHEAGALLGPYLEARLQEICELFEAELKYQVANTYTLHILSEAVTKRATKKLGNEHQLVKELNAFSELSFFRNYTAHEKNCIASLSPDEIQDALDVWETIEELVFCSDCSDWLRYTDKPKGFVCKCTHTRLRKE